MNDIVLVVNTDPTTYVVPLFHFGSIPVTDTSDIYFNITPNMHYPLYVTYSYFEVIINSVASRIQSSMGRGHVDTVLIDREVLRVIKKCPSYNYHQDFAPVNINHSLGTFVGSLRDETVHVYLRDDMPVNSYIVYWSGYDDRRNGIESELYYGELYEKKE